MSESTQYTNPVDSSLIYYVAGPMSGYAEYNYPAFTEACRILRMNSIDVVSPHEVPWPKGHETMDPETLWAYMMEATRVLLDKATGVILLPGWPGSKGVLIELEMARQRKLPVLYMDSARGMLIGM